jgi:hypothetical protein
VVGRKGGNLTGTALGPEVTNPGTDGVIGQAEALADGLRRIPFHKKGVQRGEATMQGLSGFEEEAAAGGIVHDGLRSEGAFLVTGTAER